MGTPPYEVLHPHLDNRTEFEKAEHREDKAPHLEMFSEYEDRLTRESGEQRVRQHAATRDEPAPERASAAR